MSQQSKTWDYTEHAKYYDNRPNYAPAAIEHLCRYVGADKAGCDVADIGAGTGNLTVLLKDYVKSVVAVEPNDAMRAIGIQKTKDMTNVSWKVGTGENTGLADQSVQWATFGSSFNTTDRDKSLLETHRILKAGGYFTCMWNNRDLEDPVQKKVESIIREWVPDYSHGTRREQQADVIIGSRLFNHLYYFELPQRAKVPLEQYVDAWRSVRNAYWDTSTTEGQQVLDAILKRVSEEFKDRPVLEITYVTKTWTARRVD